MPQVSRQVGTELASGRGQLGSGPNRDGGGAAAHVEGEGEEGGIGEALRGSFTEMGGGQGGSRISAWVPLSLGWHSKEAAGSSRLKTPESAF